MRQLLRRTLARTEQLLSLIHISPEGMVESCMEFLRICVEEHFTDVVISIKASNTVVMVKTVPVSYTHLSTGYIRLFDIVKYYDGLLLRVPNRQNPDKLEEVVKQEKMMFLLIFIFGCN